MPTISGLRPAPPDVLAIVGRLITTHFPHLATARIAVLVRDEALPVPAEEAEGGAEQATVAASGANNDDASLPFEYVTWYALDVWQMLDEREREAIVFHELMHMGRDENGKPAVTPHDAGVFNEEIRRYGLWWERPTEVFKSINTRKGERG